MTEHSSPERLVQAVLLPWVEEMQIKFAHMDALRQAEQIVAALREAGYMRPAPPTVDDAFTGLVEAIEELRTRVDEAPTNEGRVRAGMEMLGRVRDFDGRDDLTPEMRKYLGQQAKYLLIEVFGMPPDVVEPKRSNPDQ